MQGYAMLFTISYYTVRLSKSKELTLVTIHLYFYLLQERELKKKLS